MRAPFGARCRRLMPALRRSRIGRIICGRLNMPTPIFAVCRNLGSAAISFTAARGRRPTCRIRRIRQDARRMRDEHFPKGVNGRLRMGMALRGPCFTSAERNAEDFKFARELGLPISTHVGMAGTSDAIIVLDRFGLLGADVNYVHANMLTEKEFDLIAKSKGTISITPSTDMLMQFGTFPATGPALQRGIRSGFGVDTICSCGTDIFSEMRLALAAERSRANAPALARGEAGPDRRAPSKGHAAARDDRWRSRVEYGERNRQPYAGQAG